MPMGVKRIALVAAAVVLLLGGIIIVGSHLGSSSAPARDALSAVPTDAALVVRVPGGGGAAGRWLKSDVARGLLGGVPFFPAIDTFASRLQQVGPHQSSAETDYFISIHTPEGLPVQWLCAFEVGSAIESADELREYVFGTQGELFRERIYEGVHLRAARVNVGGQLKECHYGVADGIGLLATSAELIESAVRTLFSDHSLAHNEQFAELYSKRNYSRAITFFVQPKFFFASFRQALREPWQGVAKTLRNWTQWVAFDAELQGQMLVASGSSPLTDAEKGSVKVLQKAAPMRMVASAVLPVECDFFLRWADARAGESLCVLPTVKSNAAANSAIYTAADRERDQKLLQGVGSGEIVLAHLPFPELPEAHRWVVLLSCQSPSLAVQRLSDVLCHRAKPETRSIDRAQTIDIYTTSRPSFFNSLFSPLFNDSLATYFMGGDGAVIFASSKHTLERVAISKLRQQTLANSESFQQLKEKLSSESNFSLYLAPGYSADKLARVFAARPRDLAAWGWLDQLRSGVLQITAGKDIAYYRLIAWQGNLAQRASASQRPVWETRLNAPMPTRPLLLDTHRPPNGKVILAQDTAAVLYLISEKGAILWKRPIGELLLGEPIPVDVYSNGKIQYAFATRSKIWIIDRDGNDVDGFPIITPQPIVAPIGVFDYEGNKKYRFMAPLADRAALMYDAKGKLVTGFAPAQFDNPINRPPCHVLYNNMDFIVAADANRLYLLNRQGKERLRTSEPVVPLEGAPVVLWASRGELATVDAAGALCVISLADGAVRRVPLPGKGITRGALLLPSALDGEVCVVVVRGRTVAFFSRQGKMLAARTFDCPLAPQMHLFSFAKHDWRVGVREATTDRIWLLDMQGNPIHGFPLTGNTGFSIGRLNGTNFHLLVGGLPSLLVNYRLPE